MCPRSGLRRWLAAALIAVLGVAAAGWPAAPAAAEAGAAYVPPVDGPVLDPFRAPSNPYAAGNRGLDFATEPGAEVRAAAAGEVTFAGPVAGGLHVVVLHPDGIRTSYSFLASVAVRRGDQVGRGAVVGTAARSVHFGARAGERYLDPALLLAAGPSDVHLIPVEVRSPAPLATERRWLVAALAGTVRLGRQAAAAAEWLVERGAEAVVDGAARSLARPVLAARAALAAHRAAAELLADQRGCTPASVSPPPPRRGRRIAVLVAGYGSEGGAADVLDVDTDRLGYAPADRVQFSYAGGRVPGVGDLRGVPVTRYGAEDSMADLRRSGARLRRLLDDIAAAHPGVPVDVIAHSQGGLVAREALAGAPTGGGSPVARLVTLGSPHHGATAAGLAADLGLSAPDSVLGGALAAASGGKLVPAAASVSQMTEGSPFLRSLEGRTLPPDVAVTSIAAAGDVVVPATSSALAGATNVLVPLRGPTAHGALPGSPEAARELALALGGEGPTCASPAEVLAGVATATAVLAAELGAGAVLDGPVPVADDVVGAVGAVVGAIL